MNAITAETRRAAHESVLETLAEKEAFVYEAVSRFPDGATAYEVARMLCWQVTSVRPRLTEMQKDGRLTVIGKRINIEFSRKSCAVYAVSKKETK